MKDKMKILIILIAAVLIFVLILFISTLGMAKKPNIYIYPKHKCNLTIKLNFPEGGTVVKSIPEFKNGWDIEVEPSGIINNKFEFLFYESIQPNKWQMTTGWIIKKDSLTTFFKNNMKSYGFNDKEINDFIVYWIPLLKKNKYYMIYPQEGEVIDKLINLSISEKPDNLLRLFYVLKGVDTKEKIKDHKVIKRFKREGYCVTEWGVITK